MPETGYRLLELRSFTRRTSKLGGQMESVGLGSLKVVDKIHDRCDSSIIESHLSSDIYGTGELLTAVWNERRWRCGKIEAAVQALEDYLLCVVVKNKVCERAQSSWEQIRLYMVWNLMSTGNNRARLSNRGHIYI